ncbi:MAG: 3-hydroxyacyl-ACP dehydratase [Bacteroidota bacterium]
MLLNDFFTITGIESVDDKNIVSVELNKSHTIYDGHFPGNPVVPGVCQTQMIKEALESIIGSKLRMTTANEIKYLAVINPEVDSHLVIEMKIKTQEEGLIAVNSAIISGEKQFLKFRGTFIKE